jgi:hypothetical protein
MPDGGRLGVKTWADSEGVHCDVSDSGVGMSEEVRERALNPFFTTKGPKSTGLGLSVTYGIVQRHNGKLEIDSTPGRGTTVHITLPPVAAAISAPSRAVTAPVSTAQLRVLLVDDEPEVRSALADMLGTSGHTAFQPRGKEALAWLDAGSRSIRADRPRHAGDDWAQVRARFGRAGRSCGGAMTGWTRAKVRRDERDR